MLTVVSRAEARKGGTYWLCACECGGQKIVYAGHLTRRLIRSCGCFRIKKFTAIYDARTEKRCGGCKLPKPLSEFHADKSRGDGLMPKCKPCQLAANKISEKKHKERVKQRSKVKWQRRYQRDRERLIEKVKAYQKTPNGKLIKRAVRVRRRAREKNAVGSISASFIRALYKKQQGLCACCGEALNGEYHIDHIIPLAKDGTNEPHNIQLLTPSCNLKKGAKMPDELSSQDLIAA